MTTSRINAYRWPARLVSHKPFAAERYFITSSSIWQVFFAENYDFSFLFSLFCQWPHFLCKMHNPGAFCRWKTPRSPLQHQYGRERRGLYLFYYIKGNSLSQSLSALTALPASVLALSGANAPALPKGEPLAKPVTWHLSRKLYRHAKASPFGRGGCERSEQTERARLLPAAPPLPQEAGAANAACRRDFFRKKAVPKRPQAFRNYK